MQKVRGQAWPEGHSPTTVCRHAVSDTFHSPRWGTFHHFRSRYWFAIGRRVVFSLAGWSPRIQSRFHVSGLTWVSSQRARPFAYGAITRYGQTFQNVRLGRAFVTLWAVRRRPSRIPLPRVRNAAELTRTRFGLIPVRSPLLRESMSLSLPRGTEMFQFPPFAGATYAFGGRCPGMTPGRLPDSEISGSLPASGFPELIAA
jgi:hypothetical protein